MQQVIRNSILDRLFDRDHVRLVMIESPSGSGKSTLLRQLQAELALRDITTISLQPNGEVDAVVLATRILEGLGVSTPSIDAAAPVEPLDVVTSRLTQELRAQPTQVYVLLDDFQKVKSSTTIRLMSQLLYLDPPPPLTLVIASRVSTDIPVAALRLTGGIAEFGMDSLSFSEEEAEALRALEAKEFDPAIWRAFNEKVNGWAVALRLALVLLRDRRIDLAGLIGFSGNHREMAAYLSQLIVDGIDEQDRPLLLAAAAFETLHPDMLRAVLGPEQSRRLLGLIDALALPMDRGDAVVGGRRLHSVVADYLSAQAKVEGVDLTALQKRAAVHYQGLEQWRRAIRYALRSRDLAFAAGVVENGGGWRLIYRGEKGTLAQFSALMELAPRHYPAHPRTVLGLAISAAKRGEIDLALHLVMAISSMIPLSDSILVAELRLVDALMNLYSDRRIPADTVARLETDIEKIAEVDPVRLALTQNILCFSLLQDAHFDGAIRYGRLSVSTFRTAMSDFGAAHLPLHIAQAEFFSGRSENARKTLSEHLIPHPPETTYSVRTPARTVEPVPEGLQHETAQRGAAQALRLSRPRGLDSEYAIVAPAPPTVVEGLGRAVFLRRVTPAQPIAIDENYTAQNATVIDAGLAMALGKERLEALHLGVGQPIKIAHRSGLLAEPESCQRSEINGSGA